MTSSNVRASMLLKLLVKNPEPVGSSRTVNCPNWANLRPQTSTPQAQVCLIKATACTAPGASRSCGFVLRRRFETSAQRRTLDDAAIRPTCHTL